MNYFLARSKARLKTAHPQMFLSIPDLSTMFRFTSTSFHFIHDDEVRRLQSAINDYDSECRRHGYVSLEPANKWDIVWKEVRSPLGGNEWQATITSRVAEQKKEDPDGVLS